MPGLSTSPGSPSKHVNPTPDEPSVIKAPSTAVLSTTASSVSTTAAPAGTVVVPRRASMPTVDEKDSFSSMQRVVSVICDRENAVLSAVAEVIDAPPAKPSARPPLPSWFPQRVLEPDFPRQRLLDIIAVLTNLYCDDSSKKKKDNVRGSPDSPKSTSGHDSSLAPVMPMQPVPRVANPRANITPGMSPQAGPTGLPSSSNAVPPASISMGASRSPSTTPQTFAFRVPLSGIDPLHETDSADVSCIAVQPPSPRDAYIGLDEDDVFDGVRDESIVFFASTGAVCRPTATGGMRCAPDASALDEESSALQVHHSAIIAEDDEGNPDSVNGLTFYKRLGSGATSTVWLAVDEAADEERAVKVIDRRHAVRIHVEDDDDREGLLTEVAVMKKLRHPHITTMYDCIDDPAANHIYLVMQFIHGGAVSTLDSDGGCTIREPKEVALYALQIGSALRYCHRHHVVHGDLKPDNILVERGKDGVHLHAYLTDFGASLFRGAANFQASASNGPSGADDDDDEGAGNISLSHAPRVVGGTPALLAPEVFRGHPRSPASDMWALGCTLYALLFGKLPYGGATYNELRDSILKDDLEFPPEALRGPLRKFRPIIERLLEKRPRRRMTAWEVAHNPTLLQLAGVSGQNLAVEPVAEQSLSASWIDNIDITDITEALKPCHKGLPAPKLRPGMTAPLVGRAAEAARPPTVHDDRKPTATTTNH